MMKRLVPERNQPFLFSNYQVLIIRITLSCKIRHFLLISAKQFQEKSSQNFYFCTNFEKRFNL